jgi:replication-associated recombination protein RarA
MLTSALRDRMRPQTLADIIGNQFAKEFLRRMIDARTREHLIFTGPIGTGKSTLAEAVRREMADPMWAALLKPRFNTSHYSGVEFVRDLLAKSSFVGQRVYVLDEAHALSTQAQTALLSAMEDSASSDLFFFCTTEHHKLLPALRRRCRKIFLNPLATDERLELVARAWRTVHHEAPMPEDFMAELNTRGLGSPALILNALDNYLAGAGAEEAIRTELADDDSGASRVRRGQQASFDIERAKVLRSGGSTFAFIARAIGTPSNTVRDTFVRLGLHSPRGLNSWPATPRKFDIGRAVELRNEGKTFAKIGETLGMSAPGVWRNFKKRGIPTAVGRETAKDAK